LPALLGVFPYGKGRSLWNVNPLFFFCYFHITPGKESFPQNRAAAARTFRVLLPLPGVGAISPDNQTFHSIAFFS
jgi:hypothetical protein